MKQTEFCGKRLRRCVSYRKSRWSQTDAAKAKWKGPMQWSQTGKGF